MLRMFLCAIAVFFGARCVFAADSPAPLAPAQATVSLSLPEGFEATLFAAEPQIVQPIAFTFDDRGRLWVVECLSYPKWDPTGHDRISILEDVDHDGRFDKKTVFLDNGTNFVGIELGFGGVWVAATPNFLFIPNADGDDAPDGPPQVLLDGWDLTAKHNVFNGLTWGPDGWLYGCNGILSNSSIGKPGTPEDKRVPMNCGVWRYHPTRHTFEVVAHGTTNPWGLDFDQYGRMFVTNCVIKHLFHIIPGAHYDRMFGQDILPHGYGLLHSCADHIHWGGGSWTTSRGGEGIHSEPGGGHAHVGAMIYQGDNWPERYRHHLYTCNLHGRRVNCGHFERDGSGVVAHHGKDFLHSGDPWFRGLELKCGPDGGVYVTDWSDTGECHDYEDIHRENGRIFKVTWGKTQPLDVDLTKRSDEELVALHSHKNEWFVRHARRLLHERSAAGRLSARAAQQLDTTLKGSGNTVARLRALWTLHAIGALDDTRLGELLGDESEFVRGWAVRLELEDRKASPGTLGQLAGMAQDDPSPLVRLELASGLQRLEPNQRWEIAERLIGHAKDVDDPNLPLMNWYAIEPLVAMDPARATELIGRAAIPLIRRHTARRVASASKTGEGLTPLIALLTDSRSVEVQRDVLAGIRDALRGRRSFGMPSNWPRARTRFSGSADDDVRNQAELLAVVFNDEAAIRALKARAGDARRKAASRQQAINALTQKNDAAIVPLLQQLLDDAAVRGTAIQKLAAFESAKTPGLLVARYSRFSSGEKQDAINTLAARPAFARALLAAVERGRIPPSDVSAFTARQLGSFKDKRIDQALERVWGSVRPTAKDRLERIARYTKQLTPDVLAKADRSAGRVVYNQTCASCHKLFGEGRSVGPELTGAQRTSIEYLLTNLLDPSAVVGREYRVTIIATDTGRVVTGVVAHEDENSVTLLTSNEEITIPVDEIDARKESNVSMMPEGQLEKLSARQVRDLFGYLGSPSQVALPGE